MSHSAVMALHILKFHRQELAHATREERCNRFYSAGQAIKRGTRKVARRMFSKLERQGKKRIRLCTWLALLKVSLMSELEIAPFIKDALCVTTFEAASPVLFGHVSIQQFNVRLRAQ